MTNDKAAATYSGATPEPSAPVIPEAVRSVLYGVGTLVLATATVAGDAIPDPWGRILTGFGTGCVAVAFGYRPTRT